MAPGISVVICTYNGAALLPQTLQHLARQQVRPDIAWEVVVVDNASTDQTQAVIENEWPSNQPPAMLTVVYQPKPGLTYAREMALATAQYEFVLFCDDDNWLAPDYLTIAYDLLQRHPQIGVLGGKGELVFESPVPLWARGHGLFANGPQAPSSGRVKNNVVYGAGSIIRKTAIKAITQTNFTPLLTDRLGAKLSAGGDYELCYAIAMAGYEIWYEDRLRFKHFMPNGRLHWDYTLRLVKEGAKSQEVIVPYRIFLNKGRRSKHSFYFHLLLIAASYAAKWGKAFLNQLANRSNKEVADFYKVKAISARSKLAALAQPQILYRNFLKVKEVSRQMAQTAVPLIRAATPTPLHQKA
jgi:glycosyltransferase involved in cell wall biosynthesis